MRLRLGTRGSLLARAQSNLVAAELERAGHEVVAVTIVTDGDVRLPDTAWGEGAFVGALESALRRGEVDLAVHSAKDVPIEPEVDLVIGAYPPRADARDALVTREGSSLGALPHGATVGTDSPRRTAFLLSARPDLRIRPLHGNVDTRLRRLDAGEVDALILAVAGLSRLGREERISAILDADLITPAPGQGALAIQVRADDAAALRAVAALDDAPTRVCVELERGILEAAGGGCRAPLGALATLRAPELSVLAVAATEDGSRRVTSRWVGTSHEVGGLAARLASELIAGGYRATVLSGSRG
ncbi:MAG: hydroxymethylbilane synthase [Chloroflexi bacterium]|nr:hydroxymethylbilane synthase [Chloroflexota bacterium]